MITDDWWISYIMLLDCYFILIGLFLTIAKVSLQIISEALI